MNTRFIHVPLVVLVLLLAGCGKSEKDKSVAAKPASVSEFETMEQKVSYGIGLNMGANLARQPDVKFDQVALQKGIQDGLATAKPRIPEADIEAAFKALDQQMATVAAAAGEKNATLAKAFFDKNRTNKGVTTTASGLQYEVLQRGKGGKKPKATDTVEVHYHGTLLDGTVFDSSVQRAQTASFALNAVIPAWTEGVQLMAVGDKFKFYVPPAIGYGPRSAGKIPPNSALVFEVELIAIK